MIARVLKGGADINNEAVEFPNEADLSLNLEAAAKVGIIISQEIIKSAAKIITDKTAALATNFVKTAIFVFSGCHHTRL